MPRPACKAGHAHAPFEGRELSFAKRPGGAGMIAIAEPGSVVGAEDDERTLCQLEPVERGENLADRPIELLDHVAKWAALRAPLELFRGKDRHVRHHMR